jgi:tetratricopeptide (TPR) repeat protein
MLNELGEENIQFSTSGEEAIKLLRKNNFDIVLCDYNLGDGKDGQQVLEEARVEKILDPSAVFIMITAETSIPYVLGAVEFQPNEYLTKPFTKDLLLRRIEKAIEREDAVKLVRQALKKENFDDAIMLCKQGLSTKSPYLQTYARLLGEIYLDQGMYQEIISFFSAVLARNSFHWAMLGLGRAQFAIEEYTASAETFKSLVEANKYYIEGYDWLAKCQAALGEMQESQQTLQQGVALSPKSVPRLKELGKTAKANEELEDAAKAYRMAISHGKHSCRKSADEFVGYSDVLCEQGKPHKALLTLKEGKQSLKHRTDDQLRLSSGIVKVHMSQNHLQDAKSELKIAKHLYDKEPDRISGESALSLVEAAIATGDQELEKEVVDTVLKKNPDDSDFISQVSTLLENSSVDDSVKDLIDNTLQEMMQINAKGVELVEQGKQEEALRLFEQAAREVPSNCSFNLNAAQVMIDLMQKNGVEEGMKQKARSHLELVAKSDIQDERHRILVSRYKKLFGRESISI